MPTGQVSRIGRWLLSPAAETGPRSSLVALSGLRILVGLLWLYNVSWKLPPDFGRDSGSGVYGYTRDAVEHPVLPPYSWIVEQLVLPNFTVFGWLVLIVETALAVLLLTGTYVRVAALLGIGQSLAIGLSVAQTPGEWPWAYLMMIGIHVVLLLTAAGAVVTVDAIRAGRPGAARRLQLGWGGVVLVAALVAGLLSVGDAPTAASGAALGGPDLEVSLGSYNLLGVLALVLVGAGLVGAALWQQPVLGQLAAAVGAAAALSLYVQLGWTDSWLGGTNTSAAFFLCSALVAATAWGPLSRVRPRPRAAAVA